MVNILGVAALLISLMQLYVHISRANYPVFEEQINFSDAKDKELVSKSFQLKGGSAPLKVKIKSQVDNSWANTEISLVNESTNEITSTSQDIEYYHGVSDGESWSEGSTSKEINFCGVAPGKYHFLISITIFYLILPFFAILKTYFFIFLYFYKTNKQTFI